MTETRDGAHWAEVDEASELVHEGAYEEALLALRDVAKASPKNPYAYYFIGVALYELGQLEAARDAYRAAVKLSPGYVGARGSLALVLHAMKDFDGAAREAESALRIHKDDPDSLWAAGMSRAALGDREAAGHYLHRFLETKPDLEVAMEVRQVIEMLKLGDGPLELA